MSNFSQGQGNQGIVRRPTQLYVAQAIPKIKVEIAKRAIYGWKQKRNKRCYSPTTDPDAFAKTTPFAE